MQRASFLAMLLLTVACGGPDAPPLDPLCDAQGTCVDLSNTTVHPGPCTMGELTRLSYDDRGRLIGVESGDGATGATTEISYAADDTASRIHYSGWDGSRNVETMGGTWTFTAGGSDRTRSDDDADFSWHGTYAADLRYRSLDLVFSIYGDALDAYPNPSGDDRLLTEEIANFSDDPIESLTYRYTEGTWEGGVERVQELLSGDQVRGMRRLRYDARGHLVEAGEGTNAFRYVYDGDRLMHKEGPSGTVDYVYDDAGNRRAFVVGGTTTLYDYTCWE